MKKIVFKISEFPHYSETFVIAQINTALQLGYDVTILVRKFISENTNLIEYLNINLNQSIVIQDYNIPKSKMKRVLGWLILFFKNILDIYYIIRFYYNKKSFSLAWLYEYDFYQKFNDADIFHIQYGTNSGVVALLKKINCFKPKLIVTFHGYDAFFPINGFINDKEYYKNLFGSNCIITANTPYLANELIKLGCSEKKIRIVPVGVDTDFFYKDFSNKKDDQVIKILTVGRLENIKGHANSIEVVKKLVDKKINVKLIIIGEGSERENLEFLIKRYNLSNKIFLLGKMNAFEVRKQFWQNDLYMLLGESVENDRRETQGLATLEAQACGLPAIVFDSGGVKYTVEDGYSGFVCKQYDFDSVVDRILWFEKNKFDLERMGSNAVQFVIRNYSQSEIDRKWEKLYQMN